MPRPRCCRRVVGQPAAVVFKPAGIPARELTELVLTLDEFEAVRLADFEALYQEQAAAQMGISRPTFSRLVESARRKIAEALVQGKALRIEGGPIALVAPRRCRGCGAEWEGPSRCPRCGSSAESESPPVDGPGAPGTRCRRRGIHE